MSRPNVRVSTHERAERELRAGHRRGPLHGIPFGLKDNYDTAGIPTTANSPAFRDRCPERDATVVRLLSEAGAILLGKHAMHELAYGGVSTELPWPVPRNPWNTERDTGGSSSGSGAAVAADLSMFAMGTDTGGSVRNPAAHCGLVGLKPSSGLISRAGVMLNSYSFDHCGPADAVRARLRAGDECRRRARSGRCRERRKTGGDRLHRRSRRRDRRLEDRAHLAPVRARSAGERRSPRRDARRARDARASGRQGRRDLDRADAAVRDLQVDDPASGNPRRVRTHSRTESGRVRREATDADADRDATSAQTTISGRSANDATSRGR